uniref:Uncharacterized protein n=1 Tax=Avena sativa TaxID=4498 RepID=A0ACD5TSE4_AVESA
MHRERLYVDTIEPAVEVLTFYLNDTSNTANKAIYFDGWAGLAASAVLTAIAEDPPQSLLQNFNKIIHIDCSRWKSRRSLQRKIAQELKLPHHVMAVIDRQDEEDDFSGINESSRFEINDVGAEIHRLLLQEKCLVVFLNGSDDTIDLANFGIPLSVWGSRVLWTFRERLRLNLDISRKVDNSHLYFYATYSFFGWNYLLNQEAGEIPGYTEKYARAITDCCLYMLPLNYRGGDIMDYNWATHASSYWVCDGIIQGSQSDEAWEVANALHQQIFMDDCSSNTLPSFCSELKTPPNRWILFRDKCDVHGMTKVGTAAIHPESTSFFLAAITGGSDPPLRSLPNDMFHQSDKLCVLKLCGCTFSFSSPPFGCCRNLRFLGLDGCKDQQVEQIDKQGRPTMEFFKSVWVLDICYTDWELDLSPEIIQQMAANIREVHIKNGRFWHMAFAWRQLRNLRKLQVIDPTCSWEMGGKDEFIVLPSLPASNSLKTLVLDGCVGLEHVEGLPLSLESFTLDARSRKNDYKKAKISRISMAGCAKLSHFTLCGLLPNLEELDLSGTQLKMLDLRTKVVQIPCLQRVVLLGCEQLRVVLWFEKDFPRLNLIYIDTHGGGEMRRILHDSEKLIEGYCQAYVNIMDMRFIQSFVQIIYNDFYQNKDRFSLNLRISTTNTNGEHSCNKVKMDSESSGEILGPPVPKSLIPENSQNTYTGVAIGDITIDHGYNSEVQIKPLGYHVEIGEGISNTSVESRQGTRDIICMMNRAESLYVHDNSSITTIITEHMVSTGYYGLKLTWRHLKQCHVVRCPKMETVFITNNCDGHFNKIEALWVSDLPMAHCIWNLRDTFYSHDTRGSFAELRSIHLYSCPRLAFVLSLWWSRNAADSYFPNLETLYIVNCGALVKVFPMYQAEIATHDREGVLSFPKLKCIHLDELYKLQHICEAKMFAPMLETVRLRGCWGLRRLPAVDCRDNRRPVVDCEKDWWKKLEWDGIEVGHDPSLFEPRHSSYYKKPLSRVSVLR